MTKENKTENKITKLITKKNIKQSARQLMKFAMAGILLSVIATLLCTDASYEKTLVVSSIQNLILLIWAVYVLAKFRKNHHGKDRYYLCNLSAMGGYCILGTGFAAAVSLLGYGAGDLLAWIYTYLFFNFKCIHFFSFDYYTGYGIGLAHSAFYYSVICMVIVCLFPPVNKRLAPLLARLAKPKKHRHHRHHRHRSHK